MGAFAMIITAVVVALANRGRVQSSVYNRSRWFLFTATLLIGIHNTIQFFGHFREASVTLGWTVNLAFYIVVTHFFNMSEMNLLRAGRNMKVRYWRNFSFFVLCYAIFAVGLYTGTLINDDTPWMTATFAVAILYFIKMLELSFTLRKEMKVASKRLTDEELEERHEALHFTAKSMNWIIIFSIVAPWPGMSSSLLFQSVFGLVVMSLIVWHSINFLLYGANMAALIDVTNEITEADMIEQERNVPQVGQEDNFSFVQQRIEQWVNQRSYTDPSVTLDSALKEMGISATSLNFYLENHTSAGCYRKWLPYLRIEYAKQLMLDHPEFSLQAIAQSCGYASKSSLSHTFKAQEGMTPGEWLVKQGKFMELQH